MPPLVSILTPTYERHAFLPFLARMIARQSYPLRDIEWVVVDDSERSIQTWLDRCTHLRAALRRISYVHLPAKEPIGCKRNLTKTLAHGEYLIHMDDDDYYAPNYVETVVQMFQTPQKPPLIGATTICLMYPDTLRLMQSGPFSPNHSCGGVLSYTRKYAHDHNYRNHLKKAEEYPFIGESPVAQILHSHNIYMAFVHLRNTVPKHTVLRKKVVLRWLDVVQHADVLLFYLSLHAKDIPWATDLPGEDEMQPGTRAAYGYAFYALTVLDALRKMVQAVQEHGRM